MVNYISLSMPYTAINWQIHISFHNTCGWTTTIKNRLILCSELLLYNTPEVKVNVSLFVRLN